MAPPKLAVTTQALRKAAMKLPGATQSAACEGTVIEKAAVKVGSKTFLFLGPADVMLKLDGSRAAAAKLMAKYPGLKVSASGWTSVKLADGAPPLAVLETWVAESYRLMAPTRR